MNSMTRKLFYLQLMRAGFPVDWWTLADVFDIKNFSNGYPKSVDADGNEKTDDTILERWLSQQEMMARIQQAMGGGQQPGQKGQGRKPTGQQPPTLEQKSGDAGTRATVRESKH